MAQDVKVIANVGMLKGYGGNGVIYAGKADGGGYMFLLQQLDNNVVSWRYYPKARILAGYSTGEVLLATDLNVQLFTDAASPEFATDSSETFKVVPTVVNGEDLPRLFNLETEYSLKGDGIVTADIDKLKVAPTSANSPSGAMTGGATTGTTTTGGTTTGGAMGGLIPSDFSTLFSNPLKFIQDNMMFVFALLAVIYFVRKKKKKPLWII